MMDQDLGRSLFILLVEDEPHTRLSLELVLRRAGHNVQSSSSAGDLLGELDSYTESDRERIDLLVTDINMPGRKGDELIRELDARGYNLPVIVITAYGTPEMDALLRERGNARLLHKPFSPDSLLLVVEEITGSGRVG